MGAVGGSIASMSMRGRTFKVTSDADASVKMGGFESEQQPNGDSSTREVKKRVTWMVSGLVIEINPLLQDQEFVQEIVDNNENVDITITLTNNQVLQASGKPVGEVAYSTMNSSASISVAGPGKLTQQ